MSAVQQFILAFDHDADEAHRIAQTTSTKLQQKDTSLLEIVESLGAYINDESESLRSKAVQYLTQVLESLPSNFLSRQQLQVLCDFLCERIEDDGAVHGLFVLSKLPRFTTNMTTTAFRAIRLHFSDLKGKTQSKRFEIISLLNVLMTRHRTALRNLQSESLVGLVDVLSGERDPRNLMLAFSILRVLIAEWDIEEFVETLFDAVFCYFPITFRPPPNDPYGISAGDLKQRLQDCISASQLFAPYAFPQLIDKLDTDSVNAKRDVLKALTACASFYSPQTLSLYAITLWDSLKFEIFNAQEEELSQLASKTLQSIAQRLESPESVGDLLTTFLQPVANECNERLKEPQQRQAQPAASVLRALASTSSLALEFLTQSCMPQLLQDYQDAQSFEMKRAILDAVLEFLEGATSVSVTNTALTSPMSGQKDALFQIFSQALMGAPGNETSFRLVALNCLTASCKCNGFLDSNEIGMVVQYLDDVVLSDSQDTGEVLKDRAIQSLSEISVLSPNHVSDITIPSFLARLPDNKLSAKHEYAILESLARLELQYSLTATLARRLFSKAKILAQTAGSSEYLRAVLAAIYIIIGKHELTQDSNLQFYFDSTVHLIGGATHAKNGIDPSGREPVLLILLGRLICRILRAMDEQSQTEASQRLFAMMSRPSENNQTADPSTVLLTESESRTFTTFILAAYRRKDLLPYNEDQLLVQLNDLIDAAQGQMDPILRQNVLQQIALIVNKFLARAKIPEIEARLWDPQHGLFAPQNMSEPKIRIGFWLAKGLVLCLPRIDHILRPLLDQLSHDQHGMDIGYGFELLLCPDEILTKANGAIIRPLAAQKIFDFCLSDLSERLGTVAAATKPNYIVALSGILKYLHPDIITPRAEAILPLLLQALDLPNVGIKAAALKTLAILIRASPAAVESHAPSLINRLLGAATGRGSDMVKVRHGALECLEDFPANIKSTILIPYRPATLKGMLRVLDDPRRQVRKKAVDCRTAWLNLDEPEEDD